MFDIKQVQADAEKEIADERSKRAKDKIKDKLREIDKAKKIVANLQNEYEILLKDIGADVA
jgi:hypothetical protein